MPLGASNGRSKGESPTSHLMKQLHLSAILMIAALSAVSGQSLSSAVPDKDVRYGEVPGPGPVAPAPHLPAYPPRAGKQNKAALNGRGLDLKRQFESSSDAFRLIANFAGIDSRIPP